MKIARIAIKNFLGLDHLDISLTRPVLLVAGPNASGKTSIVHGLRFVLTDELCRVTHKKDIKELIREGAKLGSVTVSLMNSGSDTGTVFEYTRSAATGNFITPHPPPTPHPALKYCLDPPAFAEMDANARLSFLYYLMGVNRSAATITKALEERGHATAHIERIETSFSGGFNAAHTEAQGIAREGKGRWRELTGETYGEVKAATWSCEVPAVNESDVGRLQGDIAHYDEEIGALQARFGALTERAAERERLTERMAQTQRIAGEREAREGATKDVRTQIDKLAAEERDVRKWLDAAQAALTIESHAVQGTFFRCPACGESLVYSRGECKVGEPAAVDGSAEIAAAGERVKEITLALNEVANRRRIADRLLVDAINFMALSSAAADALKDMTEPRESDDAQADYADIEETIAVKTAARFAARQALERLEMAVHAHNEALAKTSRAGAIHGEIQALAALAADLAPNGLPGELLARALGPINERLADSAAMTGWAPVTIGTGAITLSGRLWALSSGSERWRANAMIIEAVAYLSGIKCFVVDSLDILEPQVRSQALAWLIEVAKEHETVIVMSTLKAQPTGLPESVQNFWLGP